MRRRVLTTTKILAVALATGPACTKTEVRPDPPPVSSAPMVASALPTTSTPAPSARSEDPKLVALRDELASTKESEALSNLTRFQPLCDKDGYPLVGNLARKAPGDGLAPSALCAEVRKKKGR